MRTADGEEYWGLSEWFDFIKVTSEELCLKWIRYREEDGKLIVDFSDDGKVALATMKFEEAVNIGRKALKARGKA